MTRRLTIAQARAKVAALDVRIASLDREARESPDWRVRHTARRRSTDLDYERAKLQAKYGLWDEEAA